MWCCGRSAKEIKSEWPCPLSGPPLPWVQGVLHCRAVIEVRTAFHQRSFVIHYGRLQHTNRSIRLTSATFFLISVTLSVVAVSIGSPPLRPFFCHA